MNSFLFIESAHAAGVIEDAVPITTVLTHALSFLLSIAGIFAILALVVSGVLYMSLRGDAARMETAKRAVWYSITGIAVVLASLVAVTQIANFF
jgi:hypothetical protein